MAQRLNISGNSPYEPVVGYSRAVRVGNVIHVAGTTATDEQGALVGIGDPISRRSRRCGTSNGRWSARGRRCATWCAPACT
jgi:enamine deaminase RidA (YjgF/YER057c/UK114 family)